MSERTDLIVGNWKMNATHLEAIQMVQKLSYRLEPADYERVEVVVGPPFTAIRSVQTVIESDHMVIKIAAQNVHWEAKGAFTGEIAPEMLAKLSVAHVIIGHSERRAMFGETDEIVNKKAKAVLANGMTPIMCVGESLEERESDRTEELVVGQVEAGFKGVAPDDVARSAIAYEPIWAIGTGRTADVDDAGDVAELIRSTIARTHGEQAAEQMRILYGGSMNAGNVKGFMAKRHIDGGLVGGASLDPDSFASIVRYWV